MALLNIVDSSEDVLEAQGHVWNHIFSYIKSMALRSAVELRIPDAIHKHGKPITLSQLAEALCINEAKSHGLYRLMRILVHSKFFDKVEQEEREEAYSLTRVSRLLIRDNPSSIAPFALSQTDPLYIDSFHHMSEWFQDGEGPSAFFTTYGMDHWEFAAKDDRFNKGFNEAMAADARLVGSILVNECKHVFEGLKAMVDVAGGTGEVSKALAGAFPGLKCVVLDLPHVVAGMEGSDHENVRFVGGDMFDFIPPADAVFLKWILHDWGYEDCIKILRKCKEAIVESKINGKKVIIVDMVVDEEKQPQDATETHLLMDMHMMANLSGKERTEKEWEKLFAAAGFQNYKITPTLGVRSIIEVIP